MSIGTKIIDYMKAQGYRIRALNIVGVEGINPDFSLNSDEFDVFNDVICIVSDDGEVKLALTATTEPGQHYTDNPMNPNGAARLCFGQYKDAYVVGQHFNQYPALVQEAGMVSVARDGNADGTRSGDMVDTGYFGINIHTTSDYADDGYRPYDIGRWSAGCQVIQNSNEFYHEFMPMVMGFGNKTYDYTLIDGSQL